MPFSISKMMGKDDDTFELENLRETICQGVTNEEIERYARVSFWLDTVLQSILGTAGLVANFFVIPILCSKEMKTIFFRLLAALAVCDNIYIFLTLLEIIRGYNKHFWMFNQLHCFFLYPMRATFLYSTIFLACSLAFERYRAIKDPCQYHLTNVGANHWKKAFMLYILPSVLLSLVFNVPRFLEIETIEIGQNMSSLSPTPLRMNPSYVFWYKNLGQLVVTGIFPLIGLCYLNYQVAKRILQRRSLEQQGFFAPSGADTNSIQSEAKRQSYILFLICICFVIGHTPRVGLNFHEFLLINTYLKRYELDCSAVEFNTLVVGSVSHLCLTFNSSINFVIYGLMSKQFKKTFTSRFRESFSKSALKSFFSAISSILLRRPKVNENCDTAEESGNMEGNQMIVMDEIGQINGVKTVVHKSATNLNQGVGATSQETVFI